MRGWVAWVRMGEDGWLENGCGLRIELENGWLEDGWNPTPAPLENSVDDCEEYMLTP